MQKANFGVIGLGVMGHMLALNMERNGFRVAGYDLEAAKVSVFAKESHEKNLVACETMEAFLDALESPRRILLMVPAGSPVDSALASLKPLLAKGDLLIDGGNTFFMDTERRSRELEELGIIYIGMGVSGGEQGALWGPAIMPGGQPQAWELVKEILEAISAKAFGEPCVAYMGPRGAGHYVKMVHNGIEYGLMQAYAEGFEILKAKEEMELDLSQISEIWRYGSVVRSWLLDLTSNALQENPELSGIKGWVADSGEGRWTVFESIDLDVPAPVITAALQARFISRQDESFSAKLLAAMRNQFGGHVMKKET